MSKKPKSKDFYKRAMKKYANIFAYHTLASIGGIEQFFYEIACKYGKSYDITVLYCHCNNDEQIKRLKEVLGEDKVIQYRQIDGMYPRLYCKNLFLCYTMQPFIDFIEADKVYEMVHSDHEQAKITFPKHDKIDEYIGVSQHITEVVKRLAPDSIVKTSYNPISIREEDKQKVLLLISATRLTAEKGKKRMEQLASELDKLGRPYLWLVFTNDKDAIQNKNIVYMPPRLDIRPFIQMVGKAGGYTVQLSDTESYCYTVVESLMLKTPVIVTDIPVFNELGIDDRYGFVLNKDLSNLDANALYDATFDIDYIPKDDSYKRYLTKSKTKEITIKMAKVRAIKPYYDTYENLRIIKVGTISANKYIYVGQTYETPLERAKLLVEKGYAQWIEQS